MNAPALPRGLYGIADSRFGDPFELALSLARGGCQTVQIRAKGWSAEDLIIRGRSEVARLRALGAIVIINDHYQAAHALKADGVHLGQDDPSPEEARETLGPDAIIGLSTHDLTQVRAAEGVSYIGFGPVFHTSTKDHAGAPRGLPLLRQAVCATALPVIAIGGINQARVASVRDSGAYGWAVASSLFTSESVSGAISRLS